MLIAHLWTISGDYVTTVGIPPFPEGLPAVVTWGAKTFLRLGDTDDYYQVFAYTAVTEMTGIHYQVARRLSRGE